MTRASAAQALLSRAAAHERHADALDRWVRRRSLRADVHRLSGAGWRFLASALGHREAEPSGLELQAAQVLSGVSVTPCATGHQWPASVVVRVPAGDVLGRRVSQVVNVCGDCADALLAAGIIERGAE